MLGIFLNNFCMFMVEKKIDTNETQNKRRQTIRRAHKTDRKKHGKMRGIAML